MLVPQRCVRKPSSRGPRFLEPVWHDAHPDFLRIDSSLPADHHARWLADVVSRLDLSAFRLSYQGYGSPAYPVEFLLAFVLFMYSRAILSPAVWAENARYDEPSKWLLRGLIPCRSQLYTFRDRVEPFLDDWHKQLIAWAVLEGVTTASRGSLDGSFVAALASRHQLKSPGRVDRRLLLLRLLVWLGGDHDKGHLAAQLAGLSEQVLTAGLLWLGLLGLGCPLPGLLDTLLGLLALWELLDPQAEVPRLPAWVPATPAGRHRVLRRYENAQQRLARKLQPYRDKKTLSKKDQRALKRLKVSLTDAEAALGWDKVGTFRPLYNVPLVQATDAPLTLAFSVLARNNDDGLLRPMMQKTKEQVGRHLDEVLADGAFVSIPDALWCEQEGIVVYAPVGKADAGPGGAAKQGEKIPKSAFRYDSVEGVYYCPEGKRLAVACRTTQKAGGGVALPVIVHRAAAEDCAGCARREQCTSSTSRGRTVKRYQGEEALERMAARMDQPQGKEIYRHRCRSVELGYADLKEHRGLRVFRCFGIKRARAQAGLVILASNGLKLMRILQQRHHAPQRASPPQITAA